MFLISESKSRKLCKKKKIIALHQKLTLKNILHKGDMTTNMEPLQKSDSKEIAVEEVKNLMLKNIIDTGNLIIKIVPLRKSDSKECIPSTVEEVKHMEPPSDTIKNKGDKTPKEKKNYFQDFTYDEKTQKYTCISCHKSYKNKATFVAHKRMTCNMEPQHQCVYCEHRARSQTLVRMHIGHTHGKWPRLNQDGVWIY